MRRYLFLSLAFVMLPACLTNAVTGDKRIVKITSNECGSEKAPFLGSGLLFERGGKTYVLTSDHVVLHGKQGYCHAVSNQAIGSQEAKFLAAEWGNGLALMEVPELPPAMELPTLGELEGIEPQITDRVQVYGFPADSEMLVHDERGRVVDPAKSRKLFALLPTLIELENAHGEFGMSGGPVFHQDGRYLGVLSHQILVPSEAGEVAGELGPESLSPDNHLLVIPAKVAFAWVREYFRDPQNFKVVFFQIPEAQRTSLLQFYSGNLFYLAWCKEKTCDITVELQEGVSKGTRSYRDSQGTLERMEKYLKEHKEVNNLGISSFRKGHYFYKAQREPVASMIDFFRRLDDPGLSPVGIASINFLSDKIKDLQKASEKTREYYDKIFRLYLNQPPKEIRNLMSVLIELENTFASSDWYITKRDVDGLLTEKSLGWELLEKKDHWLHKDVRTMFESISKAADRIAF